METTHQLELALTLNDGGVPEKCALQVRSKPTHVNLPRRLGQPSPLHPPCRSLIEVNSASLRIPSAGNFTLIVRPRHGKPRDRARRRPQITDLKKRQTDRY
jgi:hypothetical protein